jgi:DNA-binding NtrC family response regulator
LSSILIVDDEKNMLDSLSSVFKDEKFSLFTAENADKALEIISRESIDIVVSDMIMPKKSGLDLLKSIKKIRPHTGFIMMTAYASVDSAVEAMKTGADDYIAKPFNTEELIVIVRKILKIKELENENIRLKRELEAKYGLEDIITQDSQMFKIFDSIKAVAPTNTTVLILGESGTGKELVAHAFHRYSPRFKYAFLSVNCAALPENLLESELFGYEKGAFTGAQNTKIGCVEKANKGSLYLDEIGDMPLSLQAKILRFLQDKTFTRLGSSRPISVDVRIIAATNKDLSAEIKSGRFREDLYYRLNIVNISLVPLRERMGDIPLLIKHFIEKYNKMHNKKIKKITAKLEKEMREYSWPGNVRELENCIERAVILSVEDIISNKKLILDKKSLYGRKGFLGEIQPLDVIEKEAIEKALKSTKGNMKKASELLGISRSTLYSKIEKHNINETKDEK